MDDSSIHCSGSIIAPRLILTAGHCFAQNSDNYIPKDKLRIAYGTDDLGNPFIPKTIRKIKDVKVHPSYKWQEAYSDIVIVVVDKKITFSEVIYPVCLPDKENPNKNHLMRSSVTIVGFGPKDEKSKSLRQISQTVRSFNYCNGRYKPENNDIKSRPLLMKTLPNGFDETLICATNK